MAYWRDEGEWKPTPHLRYVSRNGVRMLEQKWVRKVRVKHNWFGRANEYQEDEWKSVADLTF